MIVLAVVTDAGSFLGKYRKGTVWMLRGFHLSGTFSWRTVGAGELCRRPVIKRPSGWKWNLGC